MRPLTPHFSWYPFCPIRTHIRQGSWPYPLNIQYAYSSLFRGFSWLRKCGHTSQEHSDYSLPRGTVCYTARR